MTRGEWDEKKVQRTRQNLRKLAQAFLRAGDDPEPQRQALASELQKLERRMQQ